MSFPPPPPGSAGPGSAPHMALPSMPIYSQDGKPVKSSLLPVILVALVLITSSLLYLFKSELGANLWFFVGYVLTPLIATILLGVDSLLSIRGQRNPWFSKRDWASRLIRILVILSYLVAVFHIIELGRLLGEFAVQEGWF